MELKRTFDLVAASVGIVLASPILLVCALAIKLDTRGPVLYRSTRIGQGGRHFSLLKLRSMRPDQGQDPPRLTVADDPRVTRVGRVLRRSKVDELPQLINVLKGDMSLVGPRPEDPHYVADYTPGQRRVLAVKPGITSPASITYRHEEASLVGPGAEAKYISSILPKRLTMDLEYVWSRSFWGDLRVILRTVHALLVDPKLGGAIRRRVPWLVIDAPIVFACFFVVYYLRFLDVPSPGAVDGPQVLAFKLVPVTVLYAGINRMSRLDRRVWRYATAAEVLAILRTCFFSTAILVATDLLLGWRGLRPLPLSVALTGGFMTFSGFVAVRYRSRLLTGSWRRRQLTRERPAWAMKTVIYGAGESGQLLAWRLLTLSEGKEYQVVGFVDDDREKLDRAIHGIRVLGNRDDLDRIVRSQGVDLIVLAMNNISGEEMRLVITAAQETPAKIRIVSDVFGWMSDPTAAPLREVHAEDLLGRKPAVNHAWMGREVVSSQIVLVTGAAGSIGAELCRELASLEPARLVALDTNESGLFDLATEVRTASPELSLTTVIADITREEQVRRVFEEFRPDVVFHVAAYKHVPLMEEFPEEAARVNILGTWNTLCSARAVNSKRFVLVSTDKAVNPTSIMGATKRIAEKLVMSDPATEGSARSPGTTMCTAVRFGNVLGSRGSVVPTFEKQIEMGGPVTITDPRMTRYFMEVSEAAILIIQAAALTEGHEIFMLDMGDEIRIDDLARKMIRMRGLRPDIDIKILYPGIRPGEKLTEELRHSLEAEAPTSHPQISKVTGEGRLSHTEAAHIVGEVRTAVESPCRDDARRLIRDLTMGSGSNTLEPAPNTARGRLSAL